MVKSFLFDLDDTLLPYSCSQEEFNKTLIGAFVSYFSQWVHPDETLPALMKGIEAMDKNRGDSVTNHEVFSRAFSSHVDFSADKVGQAVTDCWLTEVPKLEYLADPSPYARRIMDVLFRNGLEVVIATGLQAPRVAAEVRLGWAGIPATDYDYAFIATWDNMHTSKPHLEYYQEILDHVGRDASECLYVGDSWESEIVPASELGITSYWIVQPGTEPPEDQELLSGFGQLPQLFAWITDLLP